MGLVAPCWRSTNLGKAIRGFSYASTVTQCLGSSRTTNWPIEHGQARRARGGQPNRHGQCSGERCLRCHQLHAHL